MRYVYDALYLTLLALASPWLLYASIRGGKYREGLAARLFGFAPRRAGSGPCVWLHAVSVGEVSLLGSIIESLEWETPDCEFVISTTTKTGYDLARKRYSPRLVFYCPLDFSWAVRRALARVRPTMLLLTETEIWPNMVASAKRRKIPVAIVNGRLSDRSYRGYSRLKFLFRGVIEQLDLIAVQTPRYAENFRSLGARPETVHVTGSVKFDRAVFDRDNETTRRLARLAGFQPDDIVFLAGSTQEPEEQMVLDTYLALAPRYPELRLVITPRHPERFDEVAGLLDRSGVAWRRRCRLGDEPDAAEARILLIDTVGELGAWWGASHIAYVGGSMTRRGGQNMIEPAAYGAAVFFGPNATNFRDVVAVLVKGDASVVVHDGDEIREFVERCLADPAYGTRLGANARRIVLEQQGAVRRTADLLLDLLNAKPTGSRSRRPAA